MALMKTQPEGVYLPDFLANVENPVRREDLGRVLAMMAEVTGVAPERWGDSIIGFGRYEYARADGSRHQWFLTGASARKANLTVYIMPGFEGCARLLSRLGPHKHSVSCLYITRLARVDFGVLTEIVADSVRIMRERYG